MDTFISREEALADPGKVNDLIAQLTGGDQLPVIADTPGDFITLATGVHATVKELTGSDEEALSKALKANNGYHFMDTLLARGTSTVDGKPATPDALKNMLLGDRDELLLHIRCVTYGEDFALDGWTCPHCGGQTDIKFNLLTDIERNPLLPYTDIEPSFEIELRRGAVALVRYPTGADQLACSTLETVAERNSEMLRRCVKVITRADGSTIHVQAFPGAIAEMNIPDRRKIIDAIGEKSPGPQYHRIQFVHAECQKEVTLALSMVDLFRDLLLGL